MSVLGGGSRVGWLVPGAGDLTFGVRLRGQAPQIP